MVTSGVTPIQMQLEWINSLSLWWRLLVIEKKLNLSCYFADFKDLHLRLDTMCPTKDRVSESGQTRRE